MVLTESTPKEKALAPLVDTLQALTEGLTGIASSDRKDLSLSIGYLLQRLRGQSFLEALNAEWQKLREKGRIHADYSQTEQCHACLQEVLDCLDRDSPDKVRFDFIKGVFLVAAQEKRSDRESVLPQQYMWLARQLSSGDILVLSATYQLSIGSAKCTGSAREWLSEVAKQSGLKHSGLVEIHEKALMEKHLLTGRDNSDRSGVDTEQYRLTPLAVGLCEFLIDSDLSEKD
jgi:hypothetical protein